jgi:mono/diheme cytochrome c family protein
MGQGGSNCREKALRKVVVEGGPRNMPAWGGWLSPEKVDAVLAYVTSLWPDDVYRTWETRVQRR